MYHVADAVVEETGLFEADDWIAPVMSFLVAYPAVLAPDLIIDAVVQRSTVVRDAHPTLVLIELF